MRPARIFPFRKPLLYFRFPPLCFQFRNQRVNIPFGSSIQPFIALPLVVSGDLQPQMPAARMYDNVEVAFFIFIYLNEMVPAAQRPKAFFRASGVNFLVTAKLSQVDFVKILMRFSRMLKPEGIFS